jgi:hypothetical protein
MRKLMHARFASKCAKCGSTIKRDALIAFDTVKHIAYHDDCAEGITFENSADDNARRAERSMYASNGTSDCLYDN